LNVLGVIPARGGSKRVKRKNIRPLAEKPLIAYTIQSAIKSKKINRLIVSTDDSEVAKIAEKYGAEVPFYRPRKLAKDNTPDQPVFQHALQSLKKQDGYNPDIILNLRPTTPFRKTETINKVINEIIKTKAAIVRTMSLVTGVHHPYWMYKISDKGKAVNFINNIDINDYYQSQLLPEAYRINGVVDAFSNNTVMNGNMLSSNNIYSITISELEALDIDTEFDFNLCEFFAEKFNS